MFFVGLLTFTCLVCGLVLLAKPEKNNHVAPFMGLALLCFSFSCARYLPVEGLYNPFSYPWSIFHSLPELLFSPLAATYFIKLTHGHLSTRQLTGLYLPPLCYWLLILSLYLSQDNAGVLFFVQNNFYQLPLTLSATWNLTLLQWLESPLYNLFISLQILSCGVFCHRLIRRYHKQLNEFYSNTECVQIQTTHVSFYTFFLLCGLILFICIPGMRLSVPEELMTLLKVSALILAFFLGRTCLRIHYTARDLEWAKQNTVNHPNTPNSTDSFSSLRLLEIIQERLEKSMQEQKLYRQPSLTLGDLAQNLRTNHTCLSRLINQRYHQSFADYINTYRIGEVKELLLRYTDAPMEWISLQSGFNSYYSMYHVFKHIEQCTPGRWRARNFRK